MEIENLRVILDSLDPDSELYNTLYKTIEEKIMEKEMDVRELVYFTLSKRGYGVESHSDTVLVTIRKENEMWDFTIPLKLGITCKQYKFLCELRRSGKTNMFGAASYLMVEYDISEHEARRILIAWMDKFIQEDCDHE